jgi:GDP/UDP-N,N'-diacetylbacillosamine 2-epimerase (hydrolysing)
VKRKVCVITSSRADYGLLRWIMEAIKEDSDLILQIAATGMHLSPEFGLTYREIEKDGFQILSKVEMLISSDTAVGISKSIGLGVIGFADAFAKLEPDLLVLLGDRFEIFAAATAALVARLPIAHLHGGETTEGAFDEAFRHSITKMSQFHFVAAKEYRDRVVQLGEHPDRVYLVGGLGIDSIDRLKLMSRSELEGSLGFEFGKKNLLVTFHPATLEETSATVQMAELLAALSALTDTRIIFTMPNADTDGRSLIKMVDEFIACHTQARSFTSLGQIRYLSCIAQVDGVVGNSSSGLTEVPSFKKGTINIGDRQRGRLQAASVINCVPKRSAITAAFDKLYSASFQSDLKTVVNPYGEGGASEKIVNVLKSCSLKEIVKKEFYSLPNFEFRNPRTESYFGK